MTRAILALMILSLGISAQAAQKSQRAAKDAEAVIMPIQAGENPMPVQFQRVESAIPPNEFIGEITVGLLCVERVDMTRSSRAIELDPREYIRTFREELEASKYKVMGEDQSLFREEHAEQARYRVGGIVRGLHLDVCYQQTMFNNLRSNTANAALDIEWQVYDAVDRKVVFRDTTHGSSRSKSAQANGELQAIQAAFGQATRALLAKQDFHDLLNPASKPGAAEPARTTDALVRIKAVPPSTARFQERALDVRANVATILTMPATGPVFSSATAIS